MSVSADRLGLAAVIQQGALPRNARIQQALGKYRGRIGRSTMQLAPAVTPDGPLEAPGGAGSLFDEARRPSIL